RREDQVGARAIAVVDGVERHDRSPGDAEYVGEASAGRLDIGHDDADVVVVHGPSLPQRSSWSRSQPFSQKLTSPPCSSKYSCARARTDRAPVVPGRTASSASAICMATVT